MAAPVVESVSTLAVANSGASQVITKPTGVTAGDFLVIVVGLYGYASATTPTCTGFTSRLYHGQTVGDDTSIAVLYKTADSGDVSASNYTVNAGTANEVGPIVMYRISGSANEITWYSVDGAGTTRNNDQVLIMAASYGDSSSYTDFSAYTIISADSNPTWTEDIDDDFRNNANLNNFTVGIAHASTTDTSAITGFSVTGGAEATVLIVIPAVKNETGSNALLEVGPTFFAEAGVEVGTTGSNALLEVGPTFFSQSGSAGAPTQWTTTTKS